MSALSMIRSLMAPARWGVAVAVVAAIAGAAPGQSLVHAALRAATYRLEWIQVARDRPQIIYEGGTVTNQCFEDGSCGSWARRSQDGGRTWIDLDPVWQLPGSADFKLVSINSLDMTQDGRRIYVSLYTSAEYSPDSACYVLLTSVDGGRHWSASDPYGSDPWGEDCQNGAGWAQVAISPVDPSCVYRIDVNPDTVTLEGCGGGGDLPSGANGGDLFPDPASKHTIYIYNYDTDNQGNRTGASLQRSEDAGAHWSAVHTPAGVGFFKPVLDPQEPGLLELRPSGQDQSTGSIYLSSDHGRTWRTARCPGDRHGQCPAFVLDNVFGAGHAYAFVADGIYSFDGAGHAQARLAISNHLPFKTSGLLDVEGGARQGDPVYILGRTGPHQPAKLYRSVDGGQSWQLIG